MACANEMSDARANLTFILTQYLSLVFTFVVRLCQSFILTVAARLKYPCGVSNVFSIVTVCVHTPPLSNRRVCFRVLVPRKPFRVCPVHLPPPPLVSDETRKARGGGKRPGKAGPTAREGLIHYAAAATQLHADMMHNHPYVLGL